MSHRLGLGLAVWGTHPEKELIDQHAAGPPIHLAAMARAQQNLGGKIIRGPNLAVTFGCLAPYNPSTRGLLGELTLGLARDWGEGLVGREGGLR